MIVHTPPATRLLPFRMFSINDEPYKNNNYDANKKETMYYAQKYVISCGHLHSSSHGNHFQEIYEQYMGRQAVLHCV